MKINPIDNLIDNVALSFSKIENFETLYQTPEGIEMYNTIMRTISDYNSYQSMILNYYIPAANKSINDLKEQIRKSKYKNILKLTDEEYKENLYETIRLAYVGLFHKYESYLDATINAIDYFYKELNIKPIKTYLKEEYNYELKKSHEKFYITKKISYICNCVKHYDGYPKKNNAPLELLYANKEMKIQIQTEHLKSDINMLQTHMQNLFNTIIMIPLLQYMKMDLSVTQKDLKPDITYNKMIKTIAELEVGIESILNIKKATG